MNSTSTNKVTKKKLKIKEIFNKSFDIETAESAIGHSLQKLQQQEEKVVKKKLKKKKGCDNDPAVAAVDHLVQKSQQDEVKIVKKNFKNKQICGIDAAGAANNHLVHKSQHDDQVKNVKKNVKKKQICRIDTVIPINNHLVQNSQDEVKVVKEKLKNKQIGDIVDISGAVLSQPQNDNRIIQNINQTCNNNSTDFETTDVAIGHSLQKPERQQTDEEKFVEKNPKVNQSSDSSDIKTIGTVVSPALQQQQPDVEYYHKQAHIFMKTLKRDYKRLTLVYNACIKAEQERERRNVEEIDQLKRIYNHMQAERTDIKRKRWCRYCESEATYLSSGGTNFYCSQECEQKQNDLVSAMEETYKS